MPQVGGVWCSCQNPPGKKSGEAVSYWKSLVPAQRGGRSNGTESRSRFSIQKTRENGSKTKGREEKGGERYSGLGGKKSYRLIIRGGDISHRTEPGLTRGGRVILRSPAKKRRGDREGPTTSNRLVTF